MLWLYLVHAKSYVTKMVSEPCICSAGCSRVRFEMPESKDSAAGKSGKGSAMVHAAKMALKAKADSEKEKEKGGSGKGKSKKAE